MDERNQDRVDISKLYLGKVTIVVVCYNESPERLCCTFENIIKQDYIDKEVIVVDGGSERKTIEALKIYSSYIHRSISESDKGIYDAMNKGVMEATGEWVCFMNVGDSFHSNDVLSVMLGAEILRNNPDLIYGDSALCNFSEIVRIEHVPNKISRWFLYYGSICHQAMIIRKASFEQVGLFDTSYKLLSDKDWLFRFLEHGLSNQHCGMVVCDWDVQGVSSNVRLFEQEWTAVVKKRFTRVERAAYGSLWFLLRTGKRLKSLDFSIPYRLRLFGERIIDRK